MKEFALKHPFITWFMVSSIVDGVVRTASVITGHSEPESIRDILDEKFEELLNELRKDPKMAEAIDELQNDIDELKETTETTETTE